MDRPPQATASECSSRCCMSTTIIVRAAGRCHASKPAARMAALLAAAFVATAGGDDPPRVVAWTPSGRDGLGAFFKVYHRSVLKCSQGVRLTRRLPYPAGGVCH